MRVSYEEDLANYFGLQRRGDSGTGIVLSVRAKGNAGQPQSSRPKRMNRAPLSCADPVLTGRRQHRAHRSGKVRTDTAESRKLCMRGNSKRENREVLLVSVFLTLPDSMCWKFEPRIDTNEHECYAFHSCLCVFIRGSGSGNLASIRAHIENGTVSIFCLWCPVLQFWRSARFVHGQSRDSEFHATER